MQHVVDTLDRRLRHGEIGEITVDELHPREHLQVLLLAGDQAIHHAHAFAAPQQLLREVGTNESSTAGDEIVGHVSIPRGHATGAAVSSQRRSQPISRILSRTIIPLGRRLLAGPACSWRLSDP